METTTPAGWKDVEEHFQTCYSKKRYTRPEYAEGICKKREEVTGTPLAPYRCPHCEFWHITKNLRGEHAHHYRKFGAYSILRKKAA